MYTSQNHVLTVICRFVWVSLVWYIVMKNPDSFTDLCVYAALHRMMPISL